MLTALRQTLSKPGWVAPYNPALHCDFEHGRAWNGFSVVPPESLLTVSRASEGYAVDAVGVWRYFPANALRNTNVGVPIEQQTNANLALWCRDLTNAAWVKVTMTTALTATGIDGIANSATTCTAAGASSTILQTVVQASTADTVSFFVKRRTGTGTIEITGDGVAYTDITAALAAANTATNGWYRASVSATLVNPVLGLRVTTSGDAVDVDFAQLEAGGWATTPIFTTTVGTARAADFVLAPTIAIPTGNQITLLADFAPAPPITYTTRQFLLAVSDGGATNRFAIAREGTTGRPSYGIDATFTVIQVVAIAQNARTKLIAAYAAGSQAGSLNGGTLFTASAATTLSGLNTVSIGNNGGAGSFPAAVYKQAIFWTGQRLPNTVLVDLTR